MRLHRFFIDSQIREGIVKISDKDLTHQLKSVLRLGVGDRIVVFDGNLKEAEADIQSLTPRSVELKIEDIKENNKEFTNNTILYLAVLRRDNFELAAEKAVEAGVSKIIPLVTERTVKMNLKKDRLEKIMKEAAEQSGRGILPKLSETENFSEAINNFSDKQKNILFDSRGQDINKVLAENDKRVGVWIGPEGGFTENEIELAKGRGFKVVSLGNFTLRSETAAIVVSFLCSHKEVFKI